jgi:sugar/nucleoside kinase (ribokinase family)
VSAFPRPNSKARIRRLDRLPGGQVASATVCCARLGWRTRYVGRFGDDDLGELGRRSLSDEQVDIDAAETIPSAHTRFAIVLVDERTGERTVLWQRDPRLVITPADISDAVIASGRVVLVDAEDLEASIRAGEIARAAGTVTVVDVESVEPRVEELLSQIDVIIASEGFPEQLTGATTTGAALERLAARYRPAVAVVTLGPEGALARCDGRELHVAAFPVHCADSTGAGDAFRGGFIAALLAANGAAELGDLLRYANAVAGLSCRAPGARDGLPLPAEVESLLAAAFRVAE